MLRVHFRRVVDAARSARLTPLLSLVVVVGCQHDPYAHLYDKAAQSKPHEQLLIEPRTCVGKIKSGMTIEDVVATVGQPDRRSASNLEYLRFGFSATASRDGVVRVIQCGDPCDKTSPLIKMFAGRTKAGVGMESTRSEVIAALGQPDRSVPWEPYGAHEERLEYDAPGLSFVLADNKVHFIAVSLRQPKP
jgi:hypothetical protein